MKQILKKLLLRTSIVLCVLISANAFGQDPRFSPDGILDTVSDKFGNRIPLGNIYIPTAKFGTANVISSIVSTCQAGYFTLYFESGSIFDLSPSAATVACKVFEDISNYITSNAAPGSINIHCGIASGPSALAYAGPYFIFPSNLANQNQGIIDGQIYKALVSGTNPYLTLPLSLPYANQIYHGQVAASTFAPWNYSVTTTAIPGNEYDMYTVLLHEATHALGFLSLMRFDGLSAFTPLNINFPYYNYYSRYDMFLYDNNNNPLLAAPVASCAISGNTFAPSSYSVIGQGMSTTTVNFSQDVTTCSVAAKYIGSTTATVYTPYYFEPGSSLSHFEDMCSGTYTGSCVPTPTAPGNNNLYFNMANAVASGSCYVKRHHTPEERLVLCDLGYSVNAAYGGTAVAGSSYNYGGACSPTNIVGINDGYFNGQFTFLVVGATSTVISFTTLVANDSPTTGIYVSCLELVTNNATIFNGGSFVTVNVAPGGGLVVLKYIPVNAFGQNGNATYVFINFVPAGCNSCGMVNNGGFEFSTAGTNNCGALQNSSSTQPKLDCWYVYGTNYAADLLTTICPFIPFELGVNTLGISPPINTVAIGAVTNTNAIGLKYAANQLPASGAIVNSLNSPMINGQTYQASFWVINYGPTLGNLNTPGNPVVISLASSTSAINPLGLTTSNFPNGLDLLKSFTIAAGTTWAQVTGTFVYSPSVSASNIILGINTNTNQTVPPATFDPVFGIYYCFLDEFSLIPIPGPAFSIPSNTICTNGSISNLAQFTGTTNGTFSGPGVSYSTGQYGFNLTGTLSPGVYAIGFTYSNTSATCLQTIYQQVTVYNCCSTSTLSSFTNTLMSTSSATWTSMRFPNSFTIATGSQLYLGGEFLIDPSVKITISPGATLNLAGAHLYSCADLWQGIEVLDGGRLRAFSGGGNENLIEDAEIAIDVSSHTPTVTNVILVLQDVTFNKNYIGINLSNYTLTSNTYSTPFYMSNCLFTCRNFTFNPTSWPTATSLRSATSSTTGLTAPYGLQGAPLATLKYPKSLKPSHIAINLQNAGTSANTNSLSSNFDCNTIYLGPANGGSASDFLLFDSNETGIFASASNARIENCVFQNTRVVNSNSISTAGAAIQFTSGVENMRLDINGANSSLGCRFWDCHTAIAAHNAYYLTIEKAIIRSTHTTSSPTNSTTPLAGDRGIYINTNRFEDYKIQNNEIINVTDAIAMVCLPGSFAGGLGWFEPFTYSLTTYYSVIMYARNVTVKSNTICPLTNTAFTGTTTNYVSNAITFGGALNIWSTWSAAGIKAEDNLIYRAYNGISINGLNCIGIGYHSDGPPKMISNNTITLEEGPGGTISQNGIDFTNSVPAPSGFPTYTSQAIQSIETNTLTVYNAPLSNTNIAMIHCFGNGGITPTNPVVPAPYVICNDVSNANKGFSFEGPNTLLYWRGNNMTNLSTGLALTNSAVIGPQGTTTAASDNFWLSWTTNNHTYTDGSSNAASSKLYVRNTSSTLPTNNAFFTFNYSYGQTGNLPIVTNPYVCGGGYNQLTAPLPNAGDPSDNLSYISRMQAYRYLYYSPALIDAGSLTEAFRDDHLGTSIDVFTQVEDTLSRGNFAVAADLIGGLDPDAFNDVETNYYTFYNMYIKYMGPEHSDFSEADLATVTELAGLCPGTNGLAVYQARALYIEITGRVFNAPADCGTRLGARMANQPEIINKAIGKSSWFINVHPNPASDQLTLESSSENDLLNVVIRDLSGRLLISQSIKMNGFIANLDLSLINGAYLMTISNQNNETVIKKLLIAK